MKVPFLIGRAVFGGFFLYNGINHFTQRKALAKHAGSKNVPMPEAAVVASGVALVIGGASILAGVKPKYGAAAIAGFLAGVSPVIHDFWSVEDPNQRMQEMVHFSKNLALLGGALALMGVEEPWPMTVPVAQPSRLERVRNSAKRLLAA